MKAVAYNLANLRSPVTGIGRYALELALGGLLQDRTVIALLSNQLQQGDALRLGAERLKNSTAISGQHTKAWLGYVPGVRSLYQTRQAHLFEKAMRRVDTLNVVTHNVSYAASANLEPDVTTVFDLSHHLFAETHPSHRVAFLKRLFRRLHTHTKPIITISQSVKNEIVNYYDLEPERIHVTPLAADRTFKLLPKDICAPVLAQHDLTHKSFILSVGTLEPRKNLSMVLDAFTQLAPDIQAQFPLVLVGPQGWKSAGLQARISSLAQRGYLKQLGFVSNHALACLYSSASVFCYPSLYEGFGLPLLEAMQCGCPCITSNRGALREVAGQSAVFVDPLELDQLVEALSTLLHNPSKAQQLAELGQQRANDFSWQSTVTKTWQVYDSV